MATSPSPAAPPPKAQRAWRSTCPNCGAPVDFASAASISAVCSFCRSTLLREGQALRRIGECAELFDDHSPLQLGAQGRYQGVGFALVGRLQYAYEGGTWNEWYALFERPDGRQKGAWLSEDNGAYVLAFDQPTPADAPRAEQLTPGLARSVNKRMWSVASVQRARLRSAQGELPRPPRLEGDFVVADLRSEGSEVGTLDYSDPQRPAWATGRTVQLKELALTGLREEPEAEKKLGARALECPSCGTALEPKLSTTQSLSCPSCQAVVDISKGAGADLAYFAQLNQGDSPDEIAQPQLPLGRTGMLVLEPGKPAQAWQVVGYQERCDLPGPEDDEQTFWREYLLYNRHLGFLFLVDTNEGWSWMRPLTGAPRVKGRTLTWDGRRYTQRWMYRAKVTWVLGEFYWQVRQEETAHVTDYVGPSGWQLSCERTPKEVVWSQGCRLKADDIAKAYRLTDAQRKAVQRQAPTPGWLRRLGVWLLWAGLIVLVIALMRRCSDDDCRPLRDTFGEQSAEYQQCLRNHRSTTSGSSWGGYSSGGGGHK